MIAIIDYGVGNLFSLRSSLNKIGADTVVTADPAVIAKALGDKKGIRRYADTCLPMDESLILSAVDISGRGGCYYDMDLPCQKVGDFDTELDQEFWIAFAQNAGLTLHLRQLAGRNSHHILEGGFKSVARSLRTAVSIDPAFADEIPSTKGTL